MVPYLSLFRRRMEHFIIRRGDEFHIIDCDMALTRGQRDAIAEGSCTQTQMQAMGLSGMTIPIRCIRSLTVAGSDAMDLVIFRLKGRVLIFRLWKTYDGAQIDEFFRDIPREKYRRHRAGRDWRTGVQDPVLYGKLLRFGWFWNIFCVILGLAPLFGDWAMESWGWMVTGLCLTSVILEGFFPDYFSLFLRRRKSWFLGTGRKIYLSIGLLVALGVFWIVCRVRYHLFEPMSALSAAGVLTILAGLVLYLTCREFTEEIAAGLLTMLLVFVLSFQAFVPHFNHVLRPELQTVTGVIMDTRQTMSRFGSRSLCRVRLSDGREVEIAVSRQELESAEPGDTMDLQIGTGFFGIDYAMKTEGDTL